MTPDICTSTRCAPPNKHCPECSHAIYTGELLSKGRLHRFEFNPQFGPTFLRADGEPRERQPAWNNELWDKFNEWLLAKFPQKCECEENKAKDNTKYSESDGITLLPCPFCGGKAELRNYGGGIEVCCTGIGCYARMICVSPSRNDAIMKWNEMAI